MSDERELGRIIAKNLKRLAYESQKTQADIARDLGLKQSTVSSWMTGTRLPRMDKVDLLCKYFQCLRTDILDDNGYTQPKPPTDAELELIRAYRAADAGIKNSVCILLGIGQIQEKEKRA